MRIAYHFLTPEPPRPDLDGAVQEALWLRRRFGGSVHFLYPGRRFSRFLSPSLAGLTCRPLIRQLDREIDLHHVFLDRLRPLPTASMFRKPWIATLLTTSTKPVLRLPAMLHRASALVVPAGTESHYPRTPDGPRLEVSRPGLELANFRMPAARLHNSSFRLLVASAPWTLRQFKTKGFDALLAAAEGISFLEITFLWRGMHTSEARARIARAGLESRAALIDHEVDVTEYLRSVHATVALAHRPHLLKAYPHSLLESLAAGRPVVISSCLALAKLVSETQCGIVVDEISPDCLADALKQLIDEYSALQYHALDLDLGAFSRETFLSGYEAIYCRALSSAP